MNRERWADLKKAWRFLHPLLRGWLLLLLVIGFVLAILPFTNVPWWYAKEQRPLKTRIDLARGAMALLMLTTTTGMQFWRLKHDTTPQSDS